MTAKADETGLGDEQYQREKAEEEAATTESEGEGSSETTEEEQGEAASTESQDEGGEGESESGEGEGESESSFEDTDEPEIPTRNASYIIQRQKRTIEKQREKLRSKSDEDVDVDVDDEGSDASTEDYEESDIDRAVDRKLSPVMEKLQQEEMDREVDSLIESNPKAKSYERAIRAFMKHEAWSQVPAEAIFHHLHYKHALSEGARKRDIADREAAESGSGAGSSRRPSKVASKGEFPSADQIDEMSDEELDNLAHKTMQGGFSSTK